MLPPVVEVNGRRARLGDVQTPNAPYYSMDNVRLATSTPAEVWEALYETEFVSKTTPRQSGAAEALVAPELRELFSIGIAIPVIY